MKIFDTRQSQLTDLIVGDIVNIYTCGITPYDSAHVGHAAVYLTFDVLKRRLNDLGHEVRIIRNITDVDDDILRKARELKVNYLDLAAGEIFKFERAMEDLNISKPFSSPRATSAIANILNLIDQLVQTNKAYEVDGYVYFDVTQSEGYNEISHYGVREMLDLAAQRGGNPDDPKKRNALDVVLWQPSLQDEPYWDSRYGPGRPGWHIECVALAMRESGSTTVDIHGGGSDLIFPHHECENAEALAINSKPLANYWMHVAMVRYQGEKMSKSLGNLVFIEDLIKVYGASVVRLGLLSKHYRDSYEYADEMMDQAKERLSLYCSSLGARDNGKPLTELRNALDNDLDTPTALKALDDYAASGLSVKSCLDLLGVKIDIE